MNRLSQSFIQVLSNGIKIFIIGRRRGVKDVINCFTSLMRTPEPTAHQRNPNPKSMGEANSPQAQIDKFLDLHNRLHWRDGNNVIRAVVEISTDSFSLSKDPHFPDYFLVTLEKHGEHTAKHLSMTDA